MIGKFDVTDSSSFNFDKIFPIFHWQHQQKTNVYMEF